MKFIKYLSFVLLALVTTSAQARFLSVDPVGFSEGNSMSFNRYAYANNNPYKYVDPDGRQAVVGMISYSSGYLPHYGGDQATADGIANLYLTSTALVGGGAVAAFAESLGLGTVAYLASGGELGSSPIGKSAIKWGAQEKHFPGHNSYIPGRSTMTSDPAKLAEKAGTGQQVGKLPTGAAGSKERVDFGETIGTHIDQKGNGSPTTKGIIHYSNDGLHIVPAKP